MELHPVKHNRYIKTVRFLKENIQDGCSILDLGTPNPFSEVMKEQGYQVQNTAGENLDYEYQKYVDAPADVVTAFEIFEHMFAPFNILREIKAKQLVASIPLKLWFASAYWNKKDEWDRHYHEFEKKQFDFLLEKTGWTIVKSELWTSPPEWTKLGIRPLLRRIYPRFYIVYCKRV